MDLQTIVLVGGIATGALGAGFGLSAYLRREAQAAAPSSSLFVPAGECELRHEAIGRELAKIAGDVKREDERRHELANQVTKQIVPELVRLRSGQSATYDALEGLREESRQTREESRRASALMERLIEKLG